MSTNDGSLLSCCRRHIIVKVYLYVSAPPSSPSRTALYHDYLHQYDYHYHHDYDQDYYYCSFVIFISFLASGKKQLLYSIQMCVQGSVRTFPQTSQMPQSLRGATVLFYEDEGTFHTSVLRRVTVAIPRFANPPLPVSLPGTTQATPTPPSDIFRI